VALTASRYLRAELAHCAYVAGTAFVFAETNRDARRAARYSPILVLGQDLTRRVRRPLSGRRRLVIAVTVDPDPQAAFDRNLMVGALYVVVLPAGRDWLIDTLANPMA
jgi:hypothetical protein